MGGGPRKVTVSSDPMPATAGFPTVTWCSWIVALHTGVIGVTFPRRNGCQTLAIGIGTGKSYGLQDFLYHSPNHDVGFMGHSNYHEPPEINPEDQTVYQEGIIIVVKPILGEAGVGGVN